MRVSRRQWMQGVAAITAASQVGRAGASAAPEPNPMGLVIHSYWIRQRDPKRKFADVMAFLEHARSLGAAGVQTSIGKRSEAEIAALRQWLKDHAMYLEGMTSLPRDRDDLDRFTADLRTAADCDVTVLRAVMLSGRRYETFVSAEQFRSFRDESRKRLLLAKPAVERSGVRLAIENHKDLRAQEQLEILKQVDCPQIGVCLDTGNSIALLEEPHEVVDQLAPLAFTTHFKDMAVREYADGFLLSEVPLGTGFLDLPRVIKALRERNPGIRFNLEMITRDPLKVPCLTDRYWATFETLSGKPLARMLRLVRERGWKEPLPEVSGKPASEQLREEDQNIASCLDYSSKHLPRSVG